MPQPAVPHDAVANRVEVHLLDVGATRYADCVLCRFGDIRVLIDGAHPGDYEGKQGHQSIPDQLAEVLKQQADGLEVDLLLITHTHSDHFGCLPHLINGGQLSARYAIVADPDMGWGRNGPNSDAHPDARVRQVLESLRDDQGFAASGGADAMQFLADAPSQEDSYRTMIAKLGENGKTATYLGRDPDTGKFDPDLQSILDHFAKAGLKLDLLGPSGVQVARCAQEIAKTLGGAAGAAEDLIQHRAEADGAALVAAFHSDTLADAAGRAGNYVNLQSLVTLFTYGGRKFLFSGDMQLQDQRATKSAPPVSKVIATEVAALREAIRSHGPYDFVKIGHHGSYNSFSEEILADYGDETVLFGISTGEVSPTHPDPTVTIPILKKNKDRIQWGRTDYNRRCSFTFAGSKVTYELETGKINDARLNKADLGKPDEGAQTLSPAVPAPAVAPPALPAAAPEPVAVAAENSVTIQIPLTVSVTITVGMGDQPDAGRATAAVRHTAAVQPGGPPPAPPPRGASRPASLPDLKIGAGRDFTKLLFVTSRVGLANNIGQAEADYILAALRSCGARVRDNLPAGLTDPGASIAAARAELQGDSSIAGVVIVGGHDVIPHQIFDCLPPDVRANVDSSADDDGFIVWNDAAYGRRLDNSLQDVPVSRIPDGHLSALVFAALQAGKNSFPRPWTGLRNKLRPFADAIFQQVSKDPMLTSGNVLYTDFPPPAGKPYDVHSENIYLMLHGDHTQSNYFWGERSLGNYTNAFSVSRIPAMPGQVVFTGCCWGALTTTLRACEAVPGAPIGSKEPATSIALTFLQNGALAFVGCTGTHYSPAPNQPVSAGGAMHDAFFRFLGSAKTGGTVGPAEALLMAKQDYLKNMPHGFKDQLSVAVEYKILHEYTCLGLGW